MTLNFLEYVLNPQPYANHEYDVFKLYNVLFTVALRPPPKTLRLRTEIVATGMYTREITITDIHTRLHNYDYMQVHHILLQQ